MLKKILYIMACFVVGFLIILSSVYTNFQSTFKYMNNEAVSEKDYTKAERFFSRSIDENKFYVGDEENGVHIEVFSALNDGVRFLEDGKTSYYTLESSIQFTLFHLGDSFLLKDTTTKDETTGEETTVMGGVELYFEGSTEKAFFPFNVEGLNYYELAESFSFLVVNVAYDDYVAQLTEKGISLEAEIVSAKIFDSQLDDVYEITFAADSRPSFDTTFHNTYADVIAEYNALQEKGAKGEEVSKNESSAIESKYEQVATSSGFAQQHRVKIIYGSFKFLFPVISSALTFIAVSVLVGWLIFRKKRRNGYTRPMPKKFNAAPVKQSAPEQFTRNVFDLEEDSVVETPSNTEEVKVEETKNEE